MNEKEELINHCKLVYVLLEYCIMNNMYTIFKCFFLHLNIRDKRLGVKELTPLECAIKYQQEEDFKIIDTLLTLEEPD